ncbi:aspartic peptidase A1 [Suillus spraguei]|nr:aspartic peptidase A1 [Suillus spraguei]
MFSVASLLALLAFSITGSPAEVRNSPITLPMTRRLPFSNVTEILRSDEARVAAFMEYSTHGRRNREKVPLININWAYAVSVQIGFPPITYNLIVDSYSAITWVGASTKYVSSTGVDLKEPVVVEYSSGFFEGTIFRDTVYLSDVLAIDGMRIGVASISQGIGFDGILGIGPTMSSLGTLTNSPGDTIPSVTEYLFQQATIGHPIVGIFFKPIVTDTVNDGELYFGDAEPDIDIDKFTYTRIIQTPSSSLNWGIKLEINYGNIELMPLTIGVVDCGCTFLYIASDAYEKYKALTGGTVNNVALGLLQISAAQYYLLRDLNFYIGYHQKYSLTPNAQIWPRSLNYVIYGNPYDIFLVVKSLPTPTGAGFDFINGYVFLQRFYTVFDARRSRVGFAPTPFTGATTN